MNHFYPFNYLWRAPEAAAVPWEEVSVPGWGISPPAHSVMAANFFNLAGKLVDQGAKDARPEIAVFYYCLLLFKRHDNYCSAIVLIIIIIFPFLVKRKVPRWRSHMKEIRNCTLYHYLSLSIVIFKLSYHNHYHYDPSTGKMFLLM